MATTATCPACAAPCRTEETTAQRKCPGCGFPFPAPQGFVSEEACRHWREEARRWGEAAVLKSQARMVRAGRICVNRNGVFFVNPLTRKLCSTDPLIDAEEAESVCANSRYVLVCRRDGTVELIGRDVASAGMPVGRLHEIHSAALSPDCVYAVSIAGKVTVCGSTYEREKIESWTDVRSLSAGDNHLIGVKENGDVVLAMLPAYRGGPLDSVTGWRHVAQVASAAGCAVGLHEDGTVSFAGDGQDPRQAIAGCRDVVCVAVDDSFAYALDRTGRVHVEGGANGDQERGRRGMERLENVVAICAYRSACAALLLNGTVHAFGSISRDAIAAASARTFAISGQPGQELIR